MKNVNHLGKRLMALLIAVVLVVGQIPMGAVATDSPAEPVLSVQEELRVILSKQDVTPVQPEPAQEVQPELAEQTEQPEPVAKQYLYTAKVQISTDGTVWTDAQGYGSVWNKGTLAEAEPVVGADGSVTTEDPALSYTAIYNGRTLTVKADEAVCGDFQAVWSAAPVWSASEIIVGDAYHVSAPAANAVCGLESGAQWHLVGGIADAEGNVVAELANVNQTVDVAVYELRFNETVIYTCSAKAKVVYAPVSDVRFELNGQSVPETWFMEPQTIDVYASSDASYDVNEICPVSGGVVVGWMADDAANAANADPSKTYWKASVTVSEAGKVSVGNNGVQVNVETAAPVVNSAQSYRVDENNIRVVLDYTASASGLASIIVMDSNGAEVANITDGSTGFPVSTADNTIRIVLKSVAGKTSAPYSVSVSKMLSASIGAVQGEIVDQNGNTVILNPDKPAIIELMVAGASNDSSSAMYVNVENIKVENAEVSAEDWVYSEAEGAYRAKIEIPEEGLTGGLKLSVVAGSHQDRVASAESLVEYVYDKEAPVVTVAIDESAIPVLESTDGVKYYDADEVVYHVDIADTCANGEYRITYTIEGEGNRNIEGTVLNERVSFKVRSGEVLTGISVYAKDKAGNATIEKVENLRVVVDNDAPVITAAVVGDVASFFSGADGKYAYLEPSDEDSQSLSIVFTLEDDNLDVQALKDAGWTENEIGLLTKTVTAPVGSDMQIDLNVQDLLGNVPASNIVLSATNVGANSTLTSVLNLVPGENGVYSDTIHVLQRQADTDMTKFAPTIKLVPSVEPVNGVFNQKFNFTMTIEDNREGVVGEIDYSKTTWSIDDGIPGNFVTTKHKTPQNNTCTIPVNVHGNNESNQVNLTIHVFDNAGNSYSYTKTFSVDNLGPRFTVSYDNNKAVDQNKFNGRRVATITVDDLNFDATKINFPADVVPSWTGNVATVTFEKDGHYQGIAFSGFDAVGNETKAEDVDLTNDGRNVAPSDFYINTAIPSIQLDIKQPKVVKVIRDGVEFYDKSVTVVAKVVANGEIDENSVGYGALLCTLSGESEPRIVEFVNGFAAFEIPAESVLTGVSVFYRNSFGTYAYANEQNASEYQSRFAQSTFEFKEKGADDQYKSVVVTGYSYHDGGIAPNIAIDTKAPQITVERKFVSEDDTQNQKKGYVQTRVNADYFDKPVQYVVTVTDNFLMKGDEREISSNLIPSQIKLSYNESDSESATTHKHKLVGLDTYQVTFTVNDGMDLNELEIQVKDAVGRSAVISTVTDNAGPEGGKLDASAFVPTADNNSVEYVGNKTVVDMSAPEVKASIVANAYDADDNVVDEYQVSRFFTKKVGDELKYYVYIEPVHNEQKGNESINAEEQPDNVRVDLIFTMDPNEKNPDFDRMNSIGGNATWEIDEATGNYCAVISSEVKPGEAAKLEFNVPVVDMAGNVPEKELIITSLSYGETPADNYSSYISVQVDDAEETNEKFGSFNYGYYGATLYIDRDAPDAGFDGDAIIKTDREPIKVEGYTAPMFDGAFNFTIKFVDDKEIDRNEADGEEEDANSGMANVTWKLSGHDLVTTEYFSGTTEDGVYTIPVKIEEGAEKEIESKNMKLVVTATDKLGNIFQYHYFFLMDTKAPVVQLQAPEGWTNKVDGVQYFDHDVKYILTASDMFMSNGEVTYTIDGQTTTVNCSENDNKIEIPVESVQKLTQITYAFNDAVHTTEEVVDVKTVVDEKNPEITISANQEAPVASDSLIHYSEPVIYTIEVKDDYLSNAVGETENAPSLVLEYTIDDLNDDQDAIAYRVSLADNNSAWEFDDGVYKTEVEIKESQVLEKLKVVAVDNATNYSERDFVSKPIMVDKTVPEIEVSAVYVGKPNSFEGWNYHQKDVSYTITVSDAAMNLASETNADLLMTIVYQDRNGNDNTVKVPANKFTKVDSVETYLDKYTYKLTLKDGDALKSFTVEATDNTGNDNTVVRNESVVLDKTRPTATFKVLGNVDGYYTRDDVVYVKMKAPVSNEENKSFNDTEEVQVIVTVQDKNITLTENAYCVSSELPGDNGAWTGNVKVNQDSSVVYTKTISVKPDETGMIEIDLSVFDLAGNAIDKDGITIEPINNTTFKMDDVLKLNNGRFTATITADRRRPGSNGDIDAPAIQVTTDSSVYVGTTHVGKLELYKSSFDFNLVVSDGQLNKLNSGLKKVTWQLEDASGAVVERSYLDENFEGKDSKTYTIPVEFPGRESRTAVLTITAEDNVGNKTTFRKEFAVDNLAPRVTVTYENNDVRNEKYFKADRAANVTIEDINLDPESVSVVNTPTSGSVTMTEEDLVRGVVTGRYSFTAEGEHTFRISCQDMAGNAGNVDYVGVAVNEFIIDKTTPVINVFFDPSVASGRDEAGVLYYNKEQTVTVSVLDSYFDPAVLGSVDANMGGSYSLGGWYPGTGKHTASVTYVEGNNYSFNITVTDLAGNVSATYSSDTFSVDTTEPTIEMTEGNLSYDKLNPITGDLVLAFTINDAQGNLNFSDDNITVEFMDNQLKKKELSPAGFYEIVDEGDRTNVYLNFEKIAAVKENDGIYFVNIFAVDYAGNSYAIPELVFSLNRFGSTFITEDDNTKDFLTPHEDGFVYKNTMKGDLVIKEINPNRVWQDDSKKQAGSVLTVVVNGQSIVLQHGEDYDLEIMPKQDNGKTWYEYTYTIFTSNFMDNNDVVDGNYTILMYGVDEAGNKNSNEGNEYGEIQSDAEGNYSAKISFNLDKTAPTITVIGITNDERYEDTHKLIEMIPVDNSPMESVVVYLNGSQTEVPLTERKSDSEVWFALDEATGTYLLNIPEASGRQNVRIVATDVAGNSGETYVENFLISSNWLIQAINNPVMIGGGISLLLLLILLLVFILKKKNKSHQAV